MTVGFEIHYLRMLAWTCLIEGAVIVSILRRWPWKTPVPRGRLLAAALVPTCATLPHLWFVAGPFLQSRGIGAVVVEPFIAIAEAAILESILGLGWKRSSVLAFFANLASWGVGELLPL